MLHIPPCKLVVVSGWLSGYKVEGLNPLSRPCVQEGLLPHILGPDTVTMMTVGLYLEVNIYNILYIIQRKFLNKFWYLNKKEVEFLHFIFVFIYPAASVKKKGKGQVVSLPNLVTTL
jgi:hypothetical protein